ncbi:zinc ribbon domain-containing protein [Photobacterium toruni]|uniref:Zinc ribbon domain-containing protein n=1 Tax=Photobacterium toruni TaxID=1935446 RepID=A0ABU6LCB0_9GAMM|nr:zinc ribbon domain-containing protein [Photobacterium toruni]
MHKKCPQCAELVKKEASVCKHCGSDTTGFNFDDLPDINIVTNSRMKNEQDWNSN